MKYLCEQHRQWLAARPFAARHFWHKSLVCARAAVCNDDWSLALTQYSRAFAIADVLLDQAANSAAPSERYCSSAVELGFTLRRNLKDLTELITTVNRRMRGRHCSAVARRLLDSLARINQYDSGEPAPAWTNAVLPDCPQVPGQTLH